MQLTYWTNPYNPGKDRIYINQVPVPSGTKIWLERHGNRIRLIAKGDLGDYEQEELLQMVRDYSDQAGIQASWQALSRYLRSSPPAGNTGRRKRPSAPSQVQGAQNRPGEAAELDLRSIKIPDPVEIVIDHREPEELLALLSNLPNVHVRVESLPLGDIIINDQIVVERKCCTSPDQASDFQKSVTAADKRLFNQSERLKFEPDTLGIILIEGDVHRNSPGMLIQQIDGAISFLLTIQKLSVISTFNITHTAYFLLKIATHHRSGLGYRLGLRANKPKALLDNRCYVLEGLPGVNSELAQSLLDHFGSVSAVMNAGVQELMEVPGIGEKRAARIVEVAGS